QYGPGAENAYPGIAQAFADGSPLLFLPGGSQRGRRNTVPHFDAADNYRGVSKWAAPIQAAERIPVMLARAFTLLRTGRRAPVTLEVRVDVAGDEIERLEYTPVKPVRAGADPDDVREAVQILLKAKRPVLHVGQGVLWAEAWEELRALAEFF